MIKAVKIVWQDAESHSDWTHIDDLEDSLKLALVHTLGYKVKETEDTLYVSASIYPDNEGKLVVGDTIAIPKAWIKSIYEIKEPQTKKQKN